MSNFTLSQSFSTQGLCQTLIITDTSNYVGNSEGYSASDVQTRTFTVRDISGDIITQQTVPNTVFSITVAISLLTLNITASLDVYFGAPYNAPYGLQNVQRIPCLGV